MHRLILVLICFCCCGVHAKEKLSFAVSSFPPWTITEEEAISGIDVDIVKTISSKLNVKVEFYLCPWARCLSLLEQGEIDIAANLFKTPEREKYLSYFSEPYIKGTYRLFYLNKSAGIEINRLDDVNGKTVGHITGVRHFHQFDTNRLIQKLSVSNRLQLIGMLSKQRIDMFIGQEDVIDYLLVHSPYKSQIVKSQFRQFISEPGYFAFSKKSKLLFLQARFEQELLKLFETGNIQKLAKPYQADSALKMLINFKQP